MRENAKSAAGASRVVLDEEFAAMELLPARVRRQLHEGNIVIAAQDALMLVRMLGTDGAMRALAAEEMDELHEFNQRHHARYGYHLPALAARVSILRGGYAR